MKQLNDFKMPKIKFPKFKLKELSQIDELQIDENIHKIKEKSKELKLYPPTKYKTIKEIFDKKTIEHKDKEFILEKFDKKSEFTEITYGKFREDVIALGTCLESLLKLKGKRVIIIGENTYYWYVSYMAMLCSSGIAVPVDKELPANEIENIVKRSRADVIIYSKKKKEFIKKVKENKNITSVKYFVEMNSEDTIKDKDAGILGLIKMGNDMIKSGDDSFMKIKIDEEEFKVLIFTSGTTSNSKGVMICNKNLAENVNAVSAYVKLYPSDRFFSILPLHHTYESTIGFLVPMAVGASIAVCEGLKYIVPNLKETHPTAILAVPLLIENIYRKINESIKKSKKESLVNSMIHVTNALKSINIDIKRNVFKEIHENLGGSVRIIVSAAAPIDSKIGKWLENIGITFLQGYGLTETAPIAALTPESKPQIGSVGRPVICADIKIDNPNEKGEGEVLIKSSTLMLGYYENEEETKKVINKGWFNSGDVGYLDKDGYLYITGRSKNVIVTQNGKNIYPEEIELMLGYIKEIKESMVYGKETEGKELIITARVIPDKEYIKENYGDNLNNEEIYKIIWEKIKEINRKLTSYKAIKKLELKDDEFEKTTTMKIKRYMELKKSSSK